MNFKTLKLSIIYCNFKFKTVYILVYVSKNYQRKPCIRYLHQNYLNTFLNLFDFQITNHLYKLNYSFVCILLRIVYILHIAYLQDSFTRESETLLKFLSLYIELQEYAYLLRKRTRSALGRLQQFFANHFVKKYDLRVRIH